MKLLASFRPSNDDRGVSPVIGVIFMVSAVVIVAASIGVTVMGAADGVSDPAPRVKFDIQETGDGVKITHESGASIDGDKIKLSGAANTETISDWSGKTVSVGDSATVNTAEGELQVVWEGDSGDSSSMLASADVPDTTTRYEVAWLRDGGQWDDDVEVKMGDVTNVEDGNVYVVYSASGVGKTAGTNDKLTFNKPGAPSHGYYETHSFTLWETSEKNNELGSFSRQRTCWSCTTKWDSIEL